MRRTSASRGLVEFIYVKPNSVDQPLISNVKQPLIGLAQVVSLPGSNGLMSYYTAYGNARSSFHFGMALRHVALRLV